MVLRRKLIPRARRLAKKVVVLGFAYVIDRIRGQRDTTSGKCLPVEAATRLVSVLHKRLTHGYKEARRARRRATEKEVQLYKCWQGIKPFLYGKSFPVGPYSFKMMLENIHVTAEHWPEEDLDLLIAALVRLSRDRNPTELQACVTEILGTRGANATSGQFAVGPRFKRLFAACLKTLAARRSSYQEQSLATQDLLYEVTQIIKPQSASGYLSNNFFNAYFVTHGVEDMLRTLESIPELSESDVGAAEDDSSATETDSSATETDSSGDEAVQVAGAGQEVGEGGASAAGGGDADVYELDQQVQDVGAWEQASEQLEQFLDFLYHHEPGQEAQYAGMLEMVYDPLEGTVEDYWSELQLPVPENGVLEHAQAVLPAALEHAGAATMD